ncbi:hypothetical protein CRYUN_Cryun35bG0085500 [Craigia yunnanensis]
MRISDINICEIFQAVQKLIDEEFQGIEYLRTSTLHKKIASARHDFIKLSGSENKLEALLQWPYIQLGSLDLLPIDFRLDGNALQKGSSSLKGVENLNKFKSNDGDCPTLVCTDLAARGLDLDVDHIDYLHRTGRTARMGAKGKVTTLAAKKNLLLAERIEEAIRKNESLESLTADNVRRDIARSRITEQKGKTAKLIKVSNQKNKNKVSAHTSAKKPSIAKSVKSPAPAKPSKKIFKVKKNLKTAKTSSARKKNRPTGSSTARKLVVSKGCGVLEGVDIDLHWFSACKTR